MQPIQPCIFILLSINLALSHLSLAASGDGLIADGTLGTQVHQIGEHFLIEGGSAQGGNILHSFQAFNIEAGQSADFRAEPTTQHIISRVTGAHDSWIDGTIQSTTSPADIYLINPNGIVFGENASLDVQGAFHASTADYVVLADGQRLYVDPNQGVTLSVAAPEAFGFLDATVGTIEVSGSQLTLESDKTISLIGGEITLTGNADLTTKGGHINVVGVDSAGEVKLTMKEAAPTLPSQLAPVQILDSSVNVNGDAGGSIHITGDQVTLQDSTFSARTQNKPGQQIHIQAQTALNLTRSLVDTRTTGAGNAGDIQVQAPQIVFDMRHASREVGLHSDAIPTQAPMFDENVPLRVNLELQAVQHIGAVLLSPSGDGLSLIHLLAENQTNDFNIGFSDKATQGIREPNGPVNGLFRTQTLMSQLDGQPLDGTWHLLVFDDEPDDGPAGQILNWSIQAGGQTFLANDLPQDIPNGDAVFSSLSIQDTGWYLGHWGQAGTIQVQAAQQLQVWHDQAPPMLTAHTPPIYPFSTDSRIQIDTPSLQVNGATAADSLFRLEQNKGYFDRQNILLDGSLGQSSQRPNGPDYHLLADWGQIQGDTLFHSFTRFHLDPWESATFNGPDTIKHIIARINGPTSSLNGTLRSEIAEADLWFINPAGLVFGPHATLDLPGAFHLSTAHYVRFTDDTRWYTQTTEPSTLSAAPPAAYGFLHAPIGTIHIAGSQLSLKANQAMSVIGGEVTLESGAQLQSAGGRIDVIGMKSANEYPLLSETPVLEHLTDFAPITLSDSKLDTNGIGGGAIRLIGDPITLHDSTLSARTEGATAGQGIALHAQTQLSLIRSLVDTRTFHTGDAGDINLDAPHIVLDTRQATGLTGLHSGVLAATVPLTTVGFDIEHPFVSRLSGTLISPSGTELALMFSFNGASGEDFVNTQFSDQATQELYMGQAPYTGLFLPIEPLSMLHGEALDGLWQLNIRDDLGYFEGGRIMRWGLSAGGREFVSDNVPLYIDGETLSTLHIRDTELNLGEPFAGTLGQAGNIHVQAAQQLHIWHEQSAALLTAQGATPGDIHIDTAALQFNNTHHRTFQSIQGKGRFVQSNIAFVNHVNHVQPLQGPDYQLPAELGILKGNNVYHTFETFHLDTWESAIFSGPDHVRHIIARIQGPTSTIHGRLRNQIAGADLWLINPAGFILGQNATLGLSGALHLSTANYLRFTDNTHLDTQATDNLIFSATPPAAFGFVDATISPIQIAGSQLTVDPEHSIRLVGGDITLEAGTQLHAEAGHIDLVAVASAGEIQTDSNTAPVQANIRLTDSTLNVNNRADSTTVGSISLQGEHIIANHGTFWADHNSAATASQPSVAFKADTIQLTKGSLIATNVRGSGQGGATILAAANTIQLDDQSGIAAITWGTGQAGDTILNAGQTIQVTEASTILAYITGAGQGGDVTLNAGHDIQFAHESYLITDTQEAGLGGNVTLRAGRNIQVTHTSAITATAAGTGQGGTMVLEAGHDIQFSGGGATLAADSADTSQGGHITLSAGHNIHFSDSVVQLSSWDTGSSGDLILDATQAITFNNNAYLWTDIIGTGTSASVWLQAGEYITLLGQETRIAGSSDGPGAAGHLRIETPKLTLDGGARIQAEATANGLAGRIELELGTLIMRDQAQITTTAYSTGHAGGIGTDGKPLGILINANTLQMTDGASLRSESLAVDMGGDAGLIQLDVRDEIQLSGSSSMTTSTQGQGNAGNIMIGHTVRPTTLRLTEGAKITSGSTSIADTAGQAGNLSLLAGEQILMSNGSQLTTTSENAGGGGIHIETRDLLHIQDSQINTSVAGGTGQGGNIYIDPIFVILENSQIQANAYGGPGGNITLIADYLMHSGPSVIEASSTLSTDGVINQQAIEIDGSSLQAATEIDPLDVAQWQPIPCNQRRGKVSRLIMTGYDAHPTPLDDLLSSLGAWVHKPVAHEPQTVKTITSTDSITPTMESIALPADHQFTIAGMHTGCTWY